MGGVLEQVCSFFIQGSSSEQYLLLIFAYYFIQPTQGNLISIMTVEKAGKKKSL
jgi:hypothetical protein